MSWVVHKLICRVIGKLSQFLDSQCLDSAVSSRPISSCHVHSDFWKNRWSTVLFPSCDPGSSVSVTKLRTSVYISKLATMTIGSILTNIEKKWLDHTRAKFSTQDRKPILSNSGQEPETAAVQIQEWVDWKLVHQEQEQSSTYKKGTRIQN